ncbi:MAG: DUF975 family protein, partial [Acutalibacteraceae bacterium]
MWNRKELKKRARTTIKKNYITFICLFFFLAILGVYGNPLSNLLMSSQSEDISYEFNYTDLENTVTDYVKGVLNIDKSPSNNDSFLNNVKVTGEQKNPIYKILYIISSFSNDKISVAVILIISIVLVLLLLIFFQNVLYIGSKRFLMETRIYNGTNIGRTLYLYRQKNFVYPAYILLTKYMFNFLWWFTVAGGIIKHYEYKMIPYIIAENPNIKRKDAFLLSKEMMKGNKFGAFKLDLTMLPYRILGVLTFGIFDVLFGYPYIYAVESELYTSLRKNMISSEKSYSHHFCDENLFAIPANYEYADLPSKKQCYPGSKRPVNFGKKFAVKFDYHRNYSISSYILMFFIFSFLGWVWEVVLFLFTNGRFINRGVLFGPWLPIYGSGGVLVLILLRRFADRKWLTFLLSLSVCTVVEYFTSWLLEYIYGARWWDYSDYLININGRVCLEGALIFGLGGCVFIYILAPFLDTFITKIKKPLLVTICAL